MKQIIFTAGMVLTVAMASAQSYPKQPDPSVVKYVPYVKSEKPTVETDSLAKQDIAVMPLKEKQSKKDSAANAATQYKNS